MTGKLGVDFRGSCKDRREEDSSTSFLWHVGGVGVVINAVKKYCAKY